MARVRRKNSIAFFAPIHRTGSSLLSSILNQNNNIHSEGHSPLCGMLWDIQSSLSNEFIANPVLASHRDPEDLKKSFLNSLIDDYYQGYADKLIIDKSSYWGLAGNFEMIERYIDPDPRIIITRRDLSDVVKSYVNVYLDNGFSQEYAENYLLFGDGFHGGMLMRSIASTLWAQLSKKSNFFFVDYNSLVDNPKETMNDLYDFLEIDRFNHDFNVKERKYQDDQNFVLRGLSEVRPGLSKRKIKVVLSDNAINKIKEIEEVLTLSKKENINESEFKKIESFYIDCLK